MRVLLTKHGKLQSQAVLRREFPLFSPALLAQLDEHAMGKPVLPIGADAGRSQPARFTCLRFDDSERPVNCCFDIFHSVGNMVLVGTSLQQ
ncbi:MULTISPECIES: hypothetical protein [unclassified Caballeronia]|uniref:hypothetical protein n=1 Tax=unclassified Caballeronia TaxID=2646786 RepID=UPI00202837E6|nr:MULTISPECIES: hypothetical protein [unclassified Caballeronia]